MPEIPEAAVQAAAERMFRRHESGHFPSGLTWRDFADEAREVLDAAAPVLAEAVARKITGHMDRFERSTLSAEQRQRWRRHMGIAARIAELAFTTPDELRREAAAATAAEAAAVRRMLATPDPEVPGA